jgi:hypothetical protein
MVANEHEFVAIEEEEAIHPESGLKTIDRPSPWNRNLDREEAAMRAQPRQLVTLGPSS